MPENEAVSIKSLNPATIIPSRLSPEERIAALRALDERFASRPVPEVSVDEEEDLVREAFPFDPPGSPARQLRVTPDANGPWGPLTSQRAVSQATDGIIGAVPALVAHVRAVNTAPDSENKIHDDAIASAYGFRGGLVPGVTVYGYMTVPVLEYFSERWLERGRSTVRFKEPVYDGEEVSIDAHPADSGQLEISLGNGRARGVAWLESNPPGIEHYAERPLPSDDQRPPASHESLAPGTILGTLTTILDLAADPISAPLPAAIGPGRAAHPAVLLGLANQLLARNVVLGPWIHAASDVTNYSKAQDGETLTVRGRVAEKYQRKGHEFVVLDVLTTCGERPVQHVLHTAIWRPRAAPGNAQPAGNKAPGLGRSE